MIPKLSKANDLLLLGFAASGPDALCNWRFCVSSLQAVGAATATGNVIKMPKLAKYAQMPIEVDAGPQFLTEFDSLEMQGQLKKLILNMLSTIST